MTHPSPRVPRMQSIFFVLQGSDRISLHGDYIIKQKLPNLQVPLGQLAKKLDKFVTEPPGYPCQTGRVYFESRTNTQVQTPNCHMHKKKYDGWFDLMDEFEWELLAICDRTVSLNDNIAQYCCPRRWRDLVEGDQRWPSITSKHCSLNFFHLSWLNVKWDSFCLKCQNDFSSSLCHLKSNSWAGAWMKLKGPIFKSIMNIAVLEFVFTETRIKNPLYK